MEFQLAWRNIWRNPRRTGVIMAAVIIGVWSMIFLGALMRGIIDGMIQNNIDTLTGHVQIHQKDYPDDPVVDNRITDTGAVAQTLRTRLLAGSRWSQRIRVSTVVSNARHNTGAVMVGIQPDQEKDISFIGSSVTQGRYLKPDDTHAIVIGRALAEQMETRIGRKLILMSQDAEGDIASAAFRISGIFRAEMEATEKTYVFVTLSAAQKMLKMDDAVSEITVRLPGHAAAETVADRLRHDLSGQPLRVRSWRQILPLITAALKLYDTFVFIWFLVVFIAMGFGIVNTTLMAVFERMREFGLMKALGMRPMRIVRGILLEAALILMCGMVAGNILGLASCVLISQTGIDLSALAKGVEYAGMARVIYPHVWLKDILSANGVVLILGILVSLYPAVKAARFLPVQALAHH
jgi:ABC-type lipoprotein release transport system permease subunit